MTVSATDFVESLSKVAMCANIPVRDRRPNPQFLVMVLNPVTRTTLKNQESIRVSFIVLRMLAGGYSSANVNMEKKTMPGQRPQRDPKDNLYNTVGDYGALLAKTYENIRKGVRGNASDDSACIVPGMVFETTVFKKEFAPVFAQVSGRYDENTEIDSVMTADVGKFALCVAELQSRSSAAKATTSGSLLQLRNLSIVETPSVFGARVFADIPGTLQQSQAKRVENMDSEALSEKMKMLVNQEYIESMYVGTRHVLHLRPTTSDADVGRNADGTLYIQFRNGKEFIGAEIDRVRLHDVGGYMGSLGPGNWVENLLRFAMSRKALNIISVYDTAGEGMNGDSEIVDGMCFISVPDMLSMCIQEEAMDLKSLEESFIEVLGCKTEEDLQLVEVFESDDAEAGEKEVRVVVQKTVKKNSNTSILDEDTPRWSPAICSPKMPALWKEGRLVRIYEGEKLVLFFIASMDVLSSVAGVKRKFNDMDQDDLADFM